MRQYKKPFFDKLRRTGTLLAKAWLITLADGSKIGFTDFSKAFTLDGVDYEPNNSFSASAIKSGGNFAVDNLSVVALTSDQITEAQLKGGYYDNATIRIFLVDPTDPSAGQLDLREGVIGEVTLKNESFEAELRGLAQVLQQNIGRTYNLECDVLDLGDSRCKVVTDPVIWLASHTYVSGNSQDANTRSVVRPTVDPLLRDDAMWFRCTTAGTSGASEPTWPDTPGDTVVDGTVTWTAFRALKQRGKVTAPISRSQIIDNLRPEPAGWYAYGKLGFVSGANEGVVTGVRYYNANGQIIFLNPLPFFAKAGDEYVIYRGCDRILSTCRDVFANVHNMRGFPHMPVESEAMQTPDYVS